MFKKSHHVFGFCNLRTLLSSRNVFPYSDRRT